MHGAALAHERGGAHAIGHAAQYTDAESERLEGVRSLTQNLASTVAGTTVAGARAAAALTSDKATKIYSYASDALRGD